jgi:hypothetical protein
MADFVDGISDEPAARQMARAISGRGAFRRFRADLFEEYQDLVPVYQAFRDVRARRRAVERLLEGRLLDPGEAER